MASAATQPPPPPPAGKFEWLVIVPDKPDTLAKRLEIRPQHLAALKENVESGLFKTGGALLTEPPAPEHAKDPTKFAFHGSSLVMVAANKEEIMDTLRKDIYAQTGVWDLDNVQMFTAITAFRNK